MGKCRLYRKRLIPDECVELKDDEILRLDANIIVTRWRSLKPRSDFFGGLSCYFLKKGIKVSKICKEDGSLCRWYCDIIRTEHDPVKDTYVFTDLLADVVITPEGEVQVLDLDELAEADERGIITEEELRMSLRQLNELLSLIYGGGFKEVMTAIERYEKGQEDVYI